MPNYAPADHHEASVRKQIESGRHDNASEIVRAGLRMLEDFEAERERRLRGAIPVRLAELRRDSAKGVPADAVLSELETRHRANQAKTG